MMTSVARLKSHFKGFAAFALVLAGGTAHTVQAAPQLFEPENYAAWIDIRAVSVDGERGWRDGGFGKLRYGKGSGALNVAQAGLLWKPRLADTLTAYIMIQDVPGAENQLGIEEAYLKWKPVPKSDLRYSVRLGEFFPPISMEHDGTGWTPDRTLTPSAINSWVGEEVLVRGLEGNIQKDFGAQNLGLTLGVFTRDDTAGTLLSWRGWALHDASSADNAELPLPTGNQGYTQLFGSYQAYASKPMVEEDGRLGYYARLDWRPPAPVAINLEFYDNQGDPMTVRNGQWGWATRFYNLGARYQVAVRDEVLGQYMTGHTATGWQVGQGHHAVDVGFESGYVLWSHHFDSGAKLSGRIDYFAAKDNSLRSIDNNSETGYAATLAWIRPLTAHLDLGLETLRVQSNRPSRATQGLAAQQSQTQLQIALKVHL